MSFYDMRLPLEEFAQGSESTNSLSNGHLPQSSDNFKLDFFIVHQHHGQMMKTDGRTLPHEALETIRLLAIKRVRNGEKPSKVIQSFGFCRTTIYRWLKTAEELGEEALQSTKASGRPPLLSPEERAQVQSWITGKDPRQYGFDFGLWTRKVIAEMIEERMQKTLGLNTVGRLLRQLGVTPQRPLRRAYEQDPEAVERWKAEEYPALRKRSKEEGAEIFFLDESGIRSDSNLGKTWAPKGKKAVVKTSGKRQSINAISAVNPKGAFWYMTYKGSLNATRFLEFLKCFLAKRRKKVVLILDGHPSHRAKLVAKYVKSLEGKLELHFLPVYSPELNPDEFVWHYIKKNGVSKKPLKEKESLRERVEEDLALIKALPSLVRSFCRAKSVAYIMAPSGNSS